ncbi:MAG: hypothetical protein IKQ62_10615 [Bacteroidaceae bacterium]|nr:hypothetical protein [Bacteroidaceae bacterium]
MKKVLLLMVALLTLGGGAMNAAEVKIPIELKGAVSGVTVKAIDPTTLQELAENPEHIYAAKFTTSADFQNVFQVKNMSTADAVAQGCDRIVIEFSGDVDNVWTFHSYGGQFDGLEELGGKTSHTLMLDGDKAIDDFTIFNYGGGSKSIIIKAAYFYKPSNAKTLDVDLSALPASSENTTWSWNSETSTGTFSWSNNSWNSTELFGSGNYSAYTTLNLETKAVSADKFRIIFKFTNGTGQITIDPVATGTQSIKLADYVSLTDLANVSTIRLSGNGNNGPATGDITVSKVYLEGPNVTYIEAAEVIEVPAGTTDLNDIAGSYTALKIDYPKELKGEAATLCGDGDGSNESNHATISDYDYLCFEITKVSGGASDLRVWIWDDVNNKVVTLRPHPIAEYSTVNNWEAGYSISTAGTYAVKISDYKYLKGMKTNWGSSANMTISMVYLSKGDAPAPYLPSGKYTLVGEATGSVTLDAALADANAKIYDATGVTGTNLELTPANPNALFVANEGTLANSKNVCVNGNIANLELTDGYPFAFPAGATAAEASYSRAMSNAWGTVCLPFEMASTESCQFYTILGIEEDMLMIEEQATLPAGAPALVNVNNGSFDVTAQDVALKDVQVSNSTYPLIGTYEATDVAVTDDVNYYAISNNQFVQATSNINLPAFRAYFTAPKSNAANLRIPAGEATAIKALAGAGEVSVVGIYSANGVQQRSLQKGINVVKLSNGATQKILVK